MNGRSFVWLCALLLAMGLLACGNDDNVGVGGGGASASQIREYCSTMCAKQGECGLLIGFSEEQCRTQCEAGSSNGGTNTSTCTVSQSEFNACVNAIDDVACDDLRSGSFPEECDLCPDDNGGSDAGSDSGMADVGVGDTSGATGDCATLASCCPSIPAEAIPGCQSVAATANDLACSQALGAYQAGGFCL